MSTHTIYAAVIETASRRLASEHTRQLRHLDIGAGRGELIEELRRSIPLRSAACDFHIDRFAVKDIPCTQVNFNIQKLPYPDCQFDLVTSSEVLEHLENYRALLREAFRVAANGGTVVVTTPNVLNVNSRVRYMISGFANLFGPLPLRNDRFYSTGAHITPIPYFYLAHALVDAGFDEVELRIDKVQGTSVFWLLLWAPLIFAGRRRFMMRERKRFKTITDENADLVSAHFSWRLLVGRTVVVSAKKRASAVRAVNTVAAQQFCAPPA
jgi:SAM-dependent methyltransferase